MLSAFQKFISKEPNVSGARILVAVSGGIDSVCLVDLFVRSQIDFGIAHCNFKLRGKDSDEDEDFVRSLGEKKGVEVFVKSLDTEAYANDQNVSIQMAARTLRYEWFQEILDNHDYQYLATAHHLNDSIETSVFNFVKGTGINGLVGIRKHKDRLIRPLLFATKEEIQEYAESNQLTWRQDVSNESDKYHRNFIRHHVIETFREINPSLEKTFQDTSERLLSAALVYESHIEDLRAKYCRQAHDHWFITTDWLKDEKQVPLMYELIREFGFSYRQCKEIFSGSDQIGASFYSEGFWLVRDRTKLVITDRSEASNETSINENQETVEDNTYRYHTSTEQVSERSWPMDNWVGTFDKDKLKFPLTIRAWKQGDKFQPLGMKGKKMVSDFMIDKKIPVNLKSKVRLMVSGNEIIWIVGHRIDDRFKITDETTSAYQIKVTRQDAQTI